MAKEASLNQIIRFDGRNVFFEVLDNAFGINKIMLAFKEYDLSKPRGERFVNEITIYMDIAEFETLAYNIMYRIIDRDAMKAREAQKQGGYKFCKEVYLDMGGTFLESLALRGQSRADNKDESRVFRITPGEKTPWVLSAEKGAGKRTETGLIAPDGKPDSIIRVPMSDKDFRKFAVVVNNEIQAWRVLERSRKERAQKEHEGKWNNAS